MRSSHAPIGTTCAGARRSPAWRASLAERASSLSSKRASARRQQKPSTALNTRVRGTAAEAIVRVIDAPVDDCARPARNEPSRAGERVEAEPGIGARGADRHEQVEGVGQRRPRGQANTPDAASGAMLEHGHLVDAAVLCSERDGRPLSLAARRSGRDGRATPAPGRRRGRSRRSRRSTRRSWPLVDRMRAVHARPLQQGLPDGRAPETKRADRDRRFGHRSRDDRMDARGRAAPGQPRARGASDTNVDRARLLVDDRARDEPVRVAARSAPGRAGGNGLLARDRRRERAAAAVRLDREVGDWDPRRDQPLHATRARPDGQCDVCAAGPARRPSAGRRVRSLRVHLQHLSPAQDRLRARQPSACVGLPGARPRLARASPQAYAGARRSSLEPSSRLRSTCTRTTARSRRCSRRCWRRIELVQDRRRQTVVRLATAAGVAAVSFSPRLAGLVLNRGDVAASTGHREEATEAFGARPLAYLVPAAGNPITGGLISDHRRATLGLRWRRA